MLAQRLAATLLLATVTLGLSLPTVEAEAKSGRRAACRTQRPLKFLIRSQFVRGGVVQPAEHARALKYRVTTYGHVPGAPYEKLNPRSAASQVIGATFFGLPLRLHEKVVPALQCVERRLERTCRGPGKSYTPRAVGGLRAANTYRGGEVSNHLFGIAIDLDPERNPCCGCVAPWPDNPRCKRPSVWERTSLTKCWVESFERYGFYWLGRDKLEDTMHFEYLAKPR